MKWELYQIYIFDIEKLKPYEIYMSEFINKGMPGE
jgi:hypothetical protein